MRTLLLQEVSREGAGECWRSPRKRIANKKENIFRLDDFVVANSISGFFFGEEKEIIEQTVFLFYC